MEILDVCVITGADYACDQHVNSFMALVVLENEAVCAEFVSILNILSICV